MSDKGVSTTSALGDTELANMLVALPDDNLRIAAEAEMRVREHRAILAQAAAAERGADSAERAAVSAERQAKAAERSAEATVRYVRYTFWILVAALATVVVSVWQAWTAATH